MIKVLQVVILLVSMLVALYTQTYFNSYLTFAVTFLTAYASGFILKRLPILLVYLFFPVLTLCAIVLNFSTSDISLDIPLVLYTVVYVFYWFAGVFLSTARVSKTIGLIFFVLLYLGARFVHLVDEKQSEKLANHNVAEIFNDLNGHYSQKVTPTPTNSFFLFTWNQRCSQCKRLARDIAEISVEERIPIYPTHVSFKEKEDFQNLPDEIYYATTDSMHLLNASTTSTVFKNYQAAPVIFYRTRHGKLRTIYGYHNSNKELIHSIITQKPRSFVQQMFPDIFLYEEPFWFYLAGILLIVVIKKFRAAGKTLRNF
jgi:hypothetical protein